MTRPDVARVAARTQELRRLCEATAIRHRELLEESAQARSRRDELRMERLALRSQIEQRRDGSRTLQGRAASALLEAAMGVLGATVQDVWVDYFAVGGNASREEVAAMLAGGRPLDRLDHDRLALVLNERMADAGFGRPLAYWDGSRHQ